MERSRSDSRCLEGAAATRVPQLSRRNLGSERSRRSDDSRWTPLEKSSCMILAGDVGGTSVRLAYFERRSGKLFPVVEEVKHARDYPSFEAAVKEFRLSNAYNITCACFGVAGPVKNGYVKASNLPWIIDASVVEREADIATVHLINDLEANAYGLGELEEADLETLTPGIHGSEGNAAVISAGTGLGEAGLFWDGVSHRRFAAEGGHADFGP